MYEALVAVWTVAGDNKIYKALVVICGVVIGMHVILFAFMFAFIVYMFIVLLCGGPNW